MNLRQTIVCWIVRKIVKSGNVRDKQRLISLCWRGLREAQSIYGPILRIRSGDLTNVGAVIGYGEEIPNQIRRLSPTDVFLDVGANTGIFGLVASDIVKDGLVFSFEPNPAIYNDLCHNIERNQRQNIVALNFAVGNRDGLIRLRYKPEHSGGSKVLKDSGADHTRGESSTPGRLVPLIAFASMTFLKEAIGERRLGIKIDVEGYEINALRGLQDADLLRSADWIIAEIDEENLGYYETSKAELYDFMTDEGFSAKKGVETSGHYDEIFERR